MKILQVHNFYRQAGGEDRVLAAEAALLTAHGHDVSSYTVHNDAVDETAGWPLALKTIWNQETYRTIRRTIADCGADLVHVHNTLALISPSVYYAAAAQGVPVVQTLHNYRFLCPSTTFYRQGDICELCERKIVKYPAMKYRCYRDSFGASTAVTAMLAVHQLAGTYRNKIHTFIALTQFTRNKFREAGWPVERIVVKPNFLATDPGVGNGNGGYCLFAGRLIEEKGLQLLFNAWKSAAPKMPLKIAGEGPLQEYVQARAAELPGVEYLGPCDHARVLELLKNAAFLLLPSRWYEGMPIVVLEAMACGTPVVAFALGSLDELIIEGVNGTKLAYPDADALAYFLKNSCEFASKAAKMRDSTRTYFEAHFTAAANYPQLLAIYQNAVNAPPFAKLSDDNGAFKREE